MHSTQPNRIRMTDNLLSLLFNYCNLWLIASIIAAIEFAYCIEPIIGLATMICSQMHHSSLAENHN